MADILIEPEDWQAVRDVLGVDTRDLPDEVVTSIVGVQSAELIVKDRITDWATIMAAVPATADTVKLRLGTIYHTAVLLLPRVRNILRPYERVAELTLGTVDWKSMREELLAKANETLGLIGTTGDDTFTLFSVAGPSRAFRALKAAGLSGSAEFQNV